MYSSPGTSLPCSFPPLIFRMSLPSFAPKFSCEPGCMKREPNPPRVIVWPLPRMVVGRELLKEAPPLSMSLVRRIVYSPLVAALAVLIALLNSWLLLTSIVVCSAAKAVWGATMAQIANTAKRSSVLIRFFVNSFSILVKNRTGQFE